MSVRKSALEPVLHFHDLFRGLSLYPSMRMAARKLTQYLVGHFHDLFHGLILCP